MPTASPTHSPNATGTARTPARVRRLRTVEPPCTVPLTQQQERLNLMPTMPLTTTTTRRSPLNRQLRDAGTSRREITELVDRLRGLEWPFALDAARLRAECPVTARAIAAHAIDAVAAELHRVGNVVTAQDLLEGVAYFGWIDLRGPNSVRTAYQLFDQAARDACGQSNPDRFNAFLDADPRTAVRALTGAVVLLTHSFPEYEEEV